MLDSQAWWCRDFGIPVSPITLTVRLRLWDMEWLILYRTILVKNEVDLMSGVILPCKAP